MTITTNRLLDLLTAREQLMEDLNSIVDEYFQEQSLIPDQRLIKALCDAVEANFPIN